ncbi:MAG: hypothetical protein D6720_06460 [Gammaproteobacteria bacterium]|nr:MAG: hypothetical protein D6720_06460 [Gammaproteobacteria bacterium]
MKKSYWKILLTLVVLALLAIVGMRLIAAKKAKEAAIPPAKTYALVVPSAVAEEREFELTLPYLAEVQSDSDTTIASKVTARVLMIKPTGTQVHRGEVIAQLDASDLQAKREALRLKIGEIENQIRAKQSDLSALRKTHARNAKLLAIQAISQDKFDTEAARIDALRANIAALQSNIASLRQNIREVEDTLSYTRVVAPMDGIISNTEVSEGGTATAGHPLLTIAGGSTRRLMVRVPHEQHPTQLIWGERRCDLVPLNSTFHGLDEYSCTLETDVPAGNRVEVSLVVFSGKALFIPHDGVLSANGRHEVLVLKGDHATARPITLLHEGVEGYAVKGIEPGERYLVAKPDILLQAKAGVQIVTPRK